MLQTNAFEVAEALADPEADALSATMARSRLQVVAGLSKTAIIGNFPPRQCGLATFTRDMYACLSRALPTARFHVIAMDDPGAHHDYPREVTHRLQQNDAAGYRSLAAELNRDGTEVLFVQHEFGIYGGPSGAYVLDLLEPLNMPVITTLHTILETPTPEQRHVMRGLIRLSTTLVTMAQKGREILKGVYGVKDEQIAVVPHGAPSRPLRDTADFKARLHIQDRKTLMTFGLLSPNKGIETVIRALPDIARTCPNVTYLIVGATHPHLLRDEGEAYRDSLKALARELGVEDHVRFIAGFVGDSELVDLLQATDVYVTPYLTEAQITSGTLSYALALGRPVVSTPYWHASEALSDGVGVICPFGDTAAFATAISGLLGSESRRASMSARAHQHGLTSRWSNVADAYVERAKQDLKIRGVRPLSKLFSAGARPSWSAIARMSDDCGIFQHGKYGLPDRQHGYCTDDNCRALSLAARQSRLGELDGAQLRLTYGWASFVNHAWNPDNGRFRNFMSYGRDWLDEGGSDDCCARTFEALADVAESSLPDDLRAWAKELGQRVAAVSDHWTSVRARAILIRALSRSLDRIGDRLATKMAMAAHGQALHRLFEAHQGLDHVWFEPQLSYDNARLSEGLMLAGEAIGDTAMREDGLRSLHWLMLRQQVPGDGQAHFSPVPTSHFASGTGDHPIFDQQPIEVLATIDACLTAWRVSGDPAWQQQARRAWNWFHGGNVHGLPLMSADGGCFDGLTPEGVNHNQGAESILAHGLSWTSMQLDS